MPLTEFKIEYENKSDNMSGAVPVVIVAAGSSSRMGGVDKMFANLFGIPVIARTMLAFERNKNVSEIIVVTKEESIDEISKLAKTYMITKLTSVIKGGKTRLDSVEKGLSCINEAKGVMVHDGARPFVSDALITEMAISAEKYDCSVCAVKVKDTIKLQKADSVTTLSRDNLYAVQTPQSMNFAKYLTALKNCENKDKYTDDASVMEAAGYTTKIIEGEENNFKITTPYDLKIAEFILREEDVCE